MGDFMYMLTKEADLSRFFGTFKTEKKAQELKDEARKIWNIEFVK